MDSSNAQSEDVSLRASLSEIGSKQEKISVKDYDMINLNQVDDTSKTTYSDRTSVESEQGVTLTLNISMLSDKLKEKGLDGLIVVGGVTGYSGYNASNLQPKRQRLAMPTNIRFSSEYEEAFVFGTDKRYWDVDWDWSGSDSNLKHFVVNGYQYYEYVFGGKKTFENCNYSNKTTTNKKYEFTQERVRITVGTLYWTNQRIKVVDVGGYVGSGMDDIYAECDPMQHKFFVKAVSSTGEYDDSVWGFGYTSGYPNKTGYPLV